MCSRNLKISVVLILVLVPLITTLPHHSLSKRSSFFDLECKGIYNKSIFFRLDRICEDCYQLFRETTLHRLCKHQCFTTDYFKACVDALHLSDEIERFKNYIKLVNGGVIVKFHREICGKTNEMRYRYLIDLKRQDCFGTDFFTACVEALLLDEEMEKFEKWREMLGKKK